MFLPYDQQFEAFKAEIETHFSYTRGLGDISGTGNFSRGSQRFLISNEDPRCLTHTINNMAPVNTLKQPMFLGVGESNLPSILPALRSKGITDITIVDIDASTLLNVHKEWELLKNAPTAQDFIQIYMRDDFLKADPTWSRAFDRKGDLTHYGDLMQRVISKAPGYFLPDEHAFQAAKEAQRYMHLVTVNMNMRDTTQCTNLRILAIKHNYEFVLINVNNLHDYDFDSKRGHEDIAAMAGFMENIEIPPAPYRTDTTMLPRNLNILTEGNNNINIAYTTGLMGGEVGYDSQQIPIPEVARTVREYAQKVYGEGNYGL